MQMEMFDELIESSQAGFRLHRIEVFNWGTFDQYCWDFSPKGHNSLLTGDIGSGKSTLVDAITTLLVPHHRITYNKAAGAEGKERSLYSYVRGEYKNEKVGESNKGKAVHLRDETSYSVILGYFYNEAYEEGVTLAQVFWSKEKQTKPECFFVIAGEELKITEHFTEFGTEMKDLKKRLRKKDSSKKNNSKLKKDNSKKDSSKKDNPIELYETFKEYSRKFQNLFGIKNPQALDLFHQTISMKSVGKLTDFVRHHMLENTDVENRIRELCRNFDNLNQAHQSIVKDKHQIELLSPLVEECKRYEQLSESHRHLESCRDLLTLYFSSLKIDLLNSSIEKLTQELKKLDQKIKDCEKRIQDLASKCSELNRDIAENGGERLEAIEKEIRQLRETLGGKLEREKFYSSLVKALQFSSVSQEEDFESNEEQASSLKVELAEQRNHLNQERFNLEIEFNEIKKQDQSLTEEIHSLKERKSQIPHKSLLLREKMAAQLKVQEKDIPFVGELLCVKEGENHWEGAIERLLHNFGLSLLVPEDLYHQVSAYVDRTRFGERLVYYRVKEKELNQIHSPKEWDQRELIHKVKTKPDSRFSLWVEREIGKRFNYICCESLDEFRKEHKALTLNGQMKSGGQRHEKDDRHNLQDRRRYILGWSNEQKIQALEKELEKISRHGQDLVQKIKENQKQQQENDQTLERITKLLTVTHYHEIDWYKEEKQIQALTSEKEEIEKSSNVLETLRSKLKTAQALIREEEDNLKKLVGKEGGIQEKLKGQEEDLIDQEINVKELKKKEQEALFPQLDEFRNQALKEALLTLRSIDNQQTEVRTFIQSKIGNEQQKLDRSQNKITGWMKDYKHEYPEESIEMDTSLNAWKDYERILIHLIEEDLPKHEIRFKAMLNQETIHSIVLLSNQFEQDKTKIEDKINVINSSLEAIDYNEGSYILLQTDSNPDLEIKEFQQDLRLCMGHGLDEEKYNEDKFLNVKALIDRFNGREGTADLDKRWTKKVTDVRNWFHFSASERWREDGEEKEYFSDSSGKSGGQKEKLAYTILASALAYQFGLEWGVKKSRTFRFVVIDEAFGRGSDESTRYGLELFKKLDLQLLIITPLQKMHVIEDYIRSVHLVNNPDGKNSSLSNLTIEEYQEKKEEYLLQNLTDMNVKLT